MKTLELVWLICGILALGTWLYSDEYGAHGDFAVICSLAGVSIYLLLRSKEKVYRLFACVSLTVISAALGVALLRMVGLAG
ncbi:hypothetical protein FY133_24025 (plasmid) [Agrobacterium tumefaciens]|uniref:Uncharacterized protein n=1 Tax=Agrobacterium tumefaciens TaxID=358 RepID=A0AAP9E9Q8_AGRTU|nr:hypothetical protein [Agrobacterium tumefaciens]NSZ61102.1 hypothetical protein [Agrobacterium tumefaciens]QDY97522.1 hypothetical protein CG010_025430 [Agrobacterium tumefaciens]UXS12650.1 hypothetical protein FY155_23580 [Agrobacterium tumefaciens]UXS20011.1 hypothetical protein FY154_23570 [Agrobacterium tumefaciens]UXS27659.1 hypothetical protein FY153_24415 [Agrobacterium tumefaciens]